MNLKYTAQLVKQKPTLETELQQGLEMKAKIGDVIKKYETDKQDPEDKIAELNKDQATMNQNYKSSKEKIEQDYKSSKDKIEQDYKAAMSKTENDYKTEMTKVQIDFTWEMSKNKEAISKEKTVIETVTTDAQTELREIKGHKDFRSSVQIKQMTKKLEDLNHAVGELSTVIKDLNLNMCDCQND